MTSPAADLAWLRDLAGDLAMLSDQGQVVAASIAAVAHRLGSDITTYNHLVLGPTAHTPMPGVAPLVDQVRVRLDQHPLLEPLVSGSRGGTGPPLVLSDVISVARWRTHPLFTEVLRPHGIPLHSVCVPVLDNAHGQLEWFQLNRDRDFSPDELDLLARLQPVLVALLHRTSTGGSPASPLTGRETELLLHLARGLTVDAAASQLGVAPGTARKHIENIHRKLDTHGPVATVRRAIELGLVDPENL